ncbi:MAG: prepilin-type N-terminal cleavage/methylation domain-containing protein, partial [Gammaproteobacteria bacterium]|nr:prepilin-type N-terminal cleavage/methylation domain-containing protein [Gammaproteobacteria bacterium]
MINITSSHHNSRGFTMAEALVGLVILALGLLSLARFQTSLVESSGLTKARTAAINFGQDKVEELRNLINKGDFIEVDTSTESYTYSSGSLIAAGSDTRTGVNAIYTREWNISNTPTASNDPDRVNIDVTVTWTDATNTAQSIKLSSIVAWLDPAAGSVSTTSASNTIATLQFPAAGATIGDGSSRLDTSSPDLTISDPAPDTTRIATTLGGIIYLIDRFDVILLTATAPLTTVSGIIGLSDDAETTETELVLVDVVTSDAGYCSYPLDPSTGIPDSITPSQTKAYICYVAGGWYGGVGIFGFNPDDDVCAGKAREYRGELLSADGTVIGTLGVTENQSGDDFIITKLRNRERCRNISIPEGFTDTDSDRSPGPIEDTIVIVSTAIGAIPISGIIIIDTTSTPAASSQYTSLTVATTSTTTDPAIDKAC